MFISPVTFQANPRFASTYTIPRGGDNKDLNFTYLDEEVRGYGDIEVLRDQSTAKSVVYRVSDASDTPMETLLPLTGVMDYTKTPNSDETVWEA